MLGQDLCHAGLTRQTCAQCKSRVVHVLDTLDVLDVFNRGLQVDCGDHLPPTQCLHSARGDLLRLMCKTVGTNSFF